MIILINILLFSCNIFFDELKDNIQNFDSKNQILMLDILDYLIDKGDITIWSSISSKKFFLPIINLLKIKDIPTVQIKLLYLLKKWGIKFENQKTIIPNFSDVYSRLKNNGVEFPEYKDTDYNKYFINSNDNNEQKNLEENPNDTFYYLKYLRDILKEQNFQHKYRRLVDFLLKMNENIKLANELIDSKNLQENNEVINLLENGKDMLKDTIIGGRLKDEKLMVYTLGTSDDINNTLLRYEEYIKGLNKLRKFISYFEIHNIFKRKNNKN